MISWCKKAQTKCIKTDSLAFYLNFDTNEFDTKEYARTKSSKLGKISKSAHSFDLMHFRRFFGKSFFGILKAVNIKNELALKKYKNIHFTLG